MGGRYYNYWANCELYLYKGTSFANSVSLRTITTEQQCIRTPGCAMAQLDPASGRNPRTGSTSKQRSRDYWLYKKFNPTNYEYRNKNQPLFIPTT